jgi:NadR type nicotinamide-nucleotide adenylyltransferase
VRFRRGLVVGKLAPLHRGHELVIRRALADCDEVAVLSWARPEPAGCEAARRQRWLAALFPQVRAVVVTDALLRQAAAGELAGWSVPSDAASAETQRRFAGLLCRDLLRVEVDAVYTSEAYGDDFARALSAFFAAGGGGGRRPVQHVAVDPARVMVPISGTAIRADVHGHRDWLAPEVYASFVERVVMLGGESAGKTALASALARRFATAWVPEHGRARWEERGGRLAFADLEAIAERQVALEEEAALRARRYLFCDTSPLTTLFYSLDLFGRASRRLLELAERRYDRVVLCAPDFAFVQDGTRRDAGFRERQHAWYVEELGRRGIPWIAVRGPLPTRVRHLVDALAIGSVPLSVGR